MKRPKVSESLAAWIEWGVLAAIGSGLLLLIL
jgi:hypothetical protein